MLRSSRTKALNFLPADKVYGVQRIGHICRLDPGDPFRELKIGGADFDWPFNGRRP